MSRHCFCVVALLITLFQSACLAAEGYEVGTAAIDITPDYPVRLHGFGHRREEATDVSQRLWAKALAIRDAEHGPALVLAVDNLGVPDEMVRQLAAALQRKADLSPARLAVTSTHTHSAPMLSNVAPTIFGQPIPPEHQQRIDRYTAELAQKLEAVSLQALAELKPAELAFGIGSVSFAMNRRTPGGPVDHDLPLLVARDPAGQIRAIYTSYACHCVTLSGNTIHGDWAGSAQLAIEQQHPGAIALTAIGCGADANPSERGSTEIADRQGAAIAAEVDRLLSQGLTPIDGPLKTELSRIELLFDTHPGREEWELRAQSPDAVGHHARVQLARLDRGEPLQTTLEYPIQTWTFGEQLAMVYLPGEVVVDYALRLKRELDRTRLWINAYSNDVPCYIPSERILREGGYEGGGAMIYYDRPAHLASGLEEKIIAEVHRQLPDAFEAPKGTEGIPPRSPQQSLRMMRTKPGLQIELVASEPLVSSPVAIDWDAQGRMWVCEMYDYPTGADGNWSPGGRVKVLSDRDGDGVPDRADVFLEKIPFPTGLMAWGRGVLVCAAPNILYAEDSDGDGRADKVETLFSGFSTENYNARVNGLSLGLDNWIYGANGLLGGVIKPHKLAVTEAVDIRNRDFRFHPIRGPIDTVTGLSQQGRVRDDWGRWFGCDNGSPLLYYPHEERYLRRNPHAPPAAPILRPPGAANRVYPISRLLERFNDPDQANHFTSACGIGIYRDVLLGEELAGNAFTAEPVHNLVHRMLLDGDGQSLTRQRADDERESEFLASQDNWFRPVQVRSGPDGALYVVDMYRFVIEHPRWIPPQRLAELDVRAGAEMGRIYRIRPRDAQLRAVHDLTALDAPALADALNSPSGTERDRVHVELLHRSDPSAAATLEKLASEAPLPQVRVQALAVLDGLQALAPSTVLRALRDEHPQVRAHALRLSEPMLDQQDILAAVLRLVDDPAPPLRRQLAFTLGQTRDARAGEALARLAAGALDDGEMRLAALSSAGPHAVAMLSALMQTPNPPQQWIAPLVATAAADQASLPQALAAVVPPQDARPTAMHFASLAAVLDALEQTGAAMDADLRRQLAPLYSAARERAADESAEVALREAAIGVLGRDARNDDVPVLCALLAGGDAEPIRAAALARLRRQTDDAVAQHLLQDWPRYSPAVRAQVVDLLLGREAWTLALLEAMEQRRIQPREISLTDRQRLQTSESAGVRQRVAQIFDAPARAERTQLMAQYDAISALQGDAGRGQPLFTANCAACHVLGGSGNEVGPDLAAVRGRDDAYLVHNILDPNAVVEPRYVNYNLTLKDKRQISGIIRSETPTSLTIVTGSGASETIARSDIATIRASDLSMMPEGFEAALPPQEMADLLTFIRTHSPAKALAGNEPRTITPDSAGVLMLRAGSAEIFGEQITFESQYQNIGYWHGESDHVEWAIELPAAAEYAVHLDYACPDSSAGNTFAVKVADQALTGTVGATGPDWSTYRQVQLGTVRLGAGRHRLSVRPDGPLRGALMDLRTIALAPPDATVQWAQAQAPPPPPPADGLLRDPASIARLILDPAQDNAAREAAINANPQFAAEIIAELTRDLPPGEAEYARIPWIWRVSIACGRRNDAGEVREVLDVSLPRDDQPLRDWQAVVIGGGIINGISLAGPWPGPRIDEIIGEDDALRARWQRSIELSSAMADDEKVPTGTRYDALRMIAMEPWETHGEQLVRYLGKDVHPELQQGAVSGLADLDSPHATAALITALPDLTEGNRAFALDGLLRNEPRAMALLDAIAAGKVDQAILGDERKHRLLDHGEAGVRERAHKVL